VEGFHKLDFILIPRKCSENAMMKSMAALPDRKVATRLRHPHTAVGVANRATFVVDRKDYPHKGGQQRYRPDGGPRPLAAMRRIKVDSYKQHAIRGTVSRVPLISPG
jgi:hypothetical protein